MAYLWQYLEFELSWATACLAGRDVFRLWLAFAAHPYSLARRTAYIPVGIVH